VHLDIIYLSYTHASSPQTLHHFLPFNKREVNIHDDTTLDPSISEGLRDMVQVHFAPPTTSSSPSSPSSLGIDYEWTGIMGCSCDSYPLIGKLPLELLPPEFSTLTDPYPPPSSSSSSSSSSAEWSHWIAAGYSGNGMPQCFGAGKVIAEMIAGVRHFERDWNLLLSPQRFLNSKMPNYANNHRGEVEFA
jgi:hypothetical protein